MTSNKYFYIVTLLSKNVWINEAGSFAGRYDFYLDGMDFTRAKARESKEDYVGSKILKFENKAPYKFLGVVS